MLRTTISCPLVPLICVALLAVFCTAQEETLEDCSLAAYYAAFDRDNLPGWSRSRLARHLLDTHRRVIPYTSSSRPDVWDALMDLDAGNSSNTVHLIYRNVNVPAEPHGDATSWNREHLWPQSRGVASSGPDHTDLHALRPADWNVNAARSNLFFANCQNSTTCSVVGEANESWKNASVFSPPATVRGDIARALLYMETRYSIDTVDFSATTTSVLTLTDCPASSSSSSTTTEGQMGYLSELLAWHEQDPVDDSERLRNDKVCADWQGNRNPFVDFPDLVSLWYPITDRSIDCTEESTRSTSPTAAPNNSNTTDAVTTKKSCEELSRGDVQIVGVSADNPDRVVLVALEALADGLELYLTDNAWTGTTFQSNEGTIQLRIPSQGVPRGSIFGYNDGSQWGEAWEQYQGSFALAVAGDSIFVYCYSFDDSGSATAEEDKLHLLGAYISGMWSEDTSSSSSGNSYESMATDQSKLPESLRDVGSVELAQGWDNAVYAGITQGTKMELLEALRDPLNWIGSNSERLEYEGGEFMVEASSSSTAPKLYRLCTYMACILLMGHLFIDS